MSRVVPANRIVSDKLLIHNLKNSIRRNPTAALVAPCEEELALGQMRKRSELQEGLRRLRACLRDKKRIVRAKRVKDPGAIDGWRTIRGGRPTIYVFGDRWRAYFTSAKQRKLVETYYLKKGILVPGPDGKRTKQPLLPNTKKRAPRCYELRGPKPAATA